MDWYYEPFRQFLLPLLERKETFPSLHRLIQSLALHMINIRLFANTDNRNKHVIPPEEVSSYMQFLFRRFFI